MVVMRLVVLVPFVAHLHAVEVTRFAGSVLLGPGGGTGEWGWKRFFAGEDFFVFADAAGDFAFVEVGCGGGEVSVVEGGEAGGGVGAGGGGGDGARGGVLAAGGGGGLFHGDVAEFEDFAALEGELGEEETLVELFEGSVGGGDAEEGFGVHAGGVEGGWGVGHVGVFVSAVCGEDFAESAGDNFGVFDLLFSENLKSAFDNAGVYPL